MYILLCCLNVLTYTANTFHERMTYLILHEEKNIHTVRRDLFILSIAMEEYLSFKRQFINCSRYFLLKNQVTSVVCEVERSKNKQYLFILDHLSSETG